MSSTKRSQTTDVLAGLPAPSPADTEALRAASQVGLDLDRLGRLQQALRQPDHEELARRPILDGEPFTL